MVIGCGKLCPEELHSEACNSTKPTAPWRWWQKQLYPISASSRYNAWECRVYIHAAFLCPECAVLAGLRW